MDVHDPTPKQPPSHDEQRQAAPVTVEAIRDRLGLRDPLEHRLDARWQMADIGLRHDDVSQQEMLTRRTGRTTEMILHGLAHVANTGEPVLFVAVNKGLARAIAERAKDYAARLGLDPRRITASASLQQTRGRRPEQVFEDHTLVEFA